MSVVAQGVVGLSVIGVGGMFALLKAGVGLATLLIPLPYSGPCVIGCACLNSVNPTSDEL